MRMFSACYCDECKEVEVTFRRDSLGRILCKKHTEARMQQGGDIYEERKQVVACANDAPEKACVICATLCLTELNLVAKDMVTSELPGDEKEIVRGLLG